MSVNFIVSSRSEVIKLAPVIQEASRRGLYTKVYALRQNELLDIALDDFGLEVFASQNFSKYATSIYGTMFHWLKNNLFMKPADWVVVVGGSHAALAGATLAFFDRAKICHVEAGIRTYHLGRPYPEEGIRQMISRVADLNCCPTSSAAAFLIGERAKGQIIVSGNPIVDTIKATLPEELPRKKQVFFTHRFDDTETAIALLKQIHQFGMQFPQWEVVIPTRYAALVVEHVRALNARPIIPLPYKQGLQYIASSAFVVTDSASVQEECGYFAVPCVVTNDFTDRSESRCFGAVLVRGTNILETMQRLALDEDFRFSHQVKVNYGDGEAARRIVDAMLETK